MSGTAGHKLNCVVLDLASPVNWVVEEVWLMGRTWHNLGLGHIEHDANSCSMSPSWFTVSPELGCVAVAWLVGQARGYLGLSDIEHYTNSSSTTSNWFKLLNYLILIRIPSNHLKAFCSNYLKLLN